VAILLQDAARRRAELTVNLMFSARVLCWPYRFSRQNGGQDWIGKMIMSTNVETPDEALIPLPQPGSTGDELFQMGMLYSTGQGGAPLDYVSAHMLFNLAAMRGSEAAKAYRKEVSQAMDAAEVAEAQRQAREWLAQG
jgi:TPR repeat protein